MIDSAVAERLLGTRAVATGSPVGDSLENVNTTTLDNGARCYVTGGAGAGEWQWQFDATDTADGTTIVEPVAGGAGRWFKKSEPGVAPTPAAIDSATFGMPSTPTWSPSGPPGSAWAGPLNQISGNLTSTNITLTANSKGVKLVLPGRYLVSVSCDVIVPVPVTDVLVFINGSTQAPISRAIADDYDTPLGGSYFSGSKVVEALAANAELYLIFNPIGTCQYGGGGTLSVVGPF